MKEILESKKKELLMMILNNYKKKMNISVSEEHLKKLEQNELFLNATEEGFSKDTIKSLFEPVFDYIIENIDTEKLRESLVIDFIKVFKEDFELDKITGKTIFEYLDSHRYLEEICKPEFKKKYIFLRAGELVIEKGNVTFNTAIKRVCERVQSKNFVDLEIEELKKEISKIMLDIEPIADFYFENEGIIFLEFFLDKK